MKQPNDLALAFARELKFVRDAAEKQNLADDSLEKLHVATTGAGLTELYETLRNASENAEENLLLMHAIRRFFKRAYLTPDFVSSDIGDELISELTLAGYLENDSVTLKTVTDISKEAREYSSLRDKILQKFPRDVADRWTLDPMSAAIEAKLRDHTKNAVFADLAYNYFLAAIDADKMFGRGNRPASYEATLFIAVQQTLLKADPAAIRLSLITRYQISKTHSVDFAKFNTSIDQIFDSPALDKLNHLIDRNGAPFRILHRAMASDEKLAEHLSSEKTFLGPFDQAISESYATVNKNVNRGIVRSVVFLIITKFIIGIAAEVPYDLWVHGAIKWTALIVNLALPPLYMIALRLTLFMPDVRNTRALNREISRILFAPVPEKPFLGKKKARVFGASYNLIYGLMILAVFAGVAWLLMRYAQFEWIHLVIFFIFISTASFLGFRLSRSIREIEVGDEAQTSVTMLRDFIYMPFVAVGRSISETYSKLNIVSRFLDMFVELPLKTILGFVRRWGSFLSAKKDSF
ncbi:hypothetical protein FWG95_01375 [Candidatus Saccharibacteria bacterium]|nr:hypothetical protein [Candidatus Saccharibacteria bacterium]